MTNKQAKSELMQIYMSLSEEKKQALDVAFKAMEQADNIPVMYYPQVDGITPTVVAQADGEKSFKMRDATPEEQEAIDKYIKSISKPTGVNIFDFYEDEEQEQIDFVQPKKKIPCTIKVQADGEYISKDTVIEWLKEKDIIKMVGQEKEARKQLDELPSVAIPPEHDGCKDCVYQDNPQDAMPCRECKHNYMDKWKAKANKVGHCIDCKYFRIFPLHSGMKGRCIHHGEFCPNSDWYCADFEMD